MSAPRNVVDAARRAILDRFPDMTGMRCSSQDAPAAGKYIVTGQKSVKTADGRSLQRVIRVTVDSTGRVLRVSASK